MVKATAMENKDLNPKTLSTPKDGFVQKKKNQKFKQTPTGKIPVINGSKASNNNNTKKQNTSPQKFSMKVKQQNKVNSPKTNKPQSSKKESNKKGVNKSQGNESASEEDINEGVVIKEETDDTDSEVESDENVQEKKVPNILGISLADDTEEDDEEFKVTNEKGKLQVNKGVKMFKGLKSSSKGSNSLKNSDTSGNETSLVDDSDDDEDDDEEMEDDDSEDVEEEEDDDDDDDDENEEEDNDDDEEEDDDDDEEEESENEGEESALGTKALLGQSIADDDDDEDFIEPEGPEEDDDISDEDEEEGEGDNSTLDNSNQSNNSKDEDSSFEHLNADGKTIFVGNLPKEVTDKQLRKLFKKFGAIDAIRIRGIIPKSPGISKKVAAITKKIHPKLQTVYAYVRFESEESAKAALKLNGTLFEGNRLRVDEANKSERKYDPKKSIFLGNLSFQADIDTVWKHFEKCGEIESVHIAKDTRTGLGRGIGYVNFKTEDAVALAFELNGTPILNRNIIVKQYVEHSKRKFRKRSHSSGSDKHGSPRKQFKQNSGKPLAAQNKENVKKAEAQQKVDKKQTSTFQGQKADKNKKKPESKLDKKKKILAQKLAAKSKKPTK